MMSPREPGVRVRLLIVDDSPQICRLVSRMLDATEFNVIGSASTSSEAIALAETLNPEIVLLDRGLPDDNSFETLRSLVRLLPKVKVVIFSGDFSPTLISQAIELGAQGYVSKGSSTTGIVYALRAALGDVAQSTAR